MRGIILVRILGVSVQNKTRQRAADSINNTARRSNAGLFLNQTTILPIESTRSQSCSYLELSSGAYARKIPTH